LLTGRNLNDLELEIKNRDNDIMRQAMAQQQLKERFHQIKNKDVTDIVREAHANVE